MFDNLSNRLQGVIKKVSGNHKLTESNMNEMLREIRLALLEADVNFKVVREFVNSVKEKALGENVLSALNPSQMVVKIVDEELTKILGGEKAELNLANKPTVIMVVGLQGAGKTTHIGKLGKMLKEKKAKNPLFIAGDIYRPAAIEQLKVLGEQVSVPVYDKGTDAKVVDIVNEGLELAKQNNHDVVFIDTAGRLHIDEALMNELVEVKNAANPDEILLVLDAMTGQDAVNVATTFNEVLDVTGAILTKLDGDARGGAALSIRHITGVPIKFIGIGETLDALEEFHPDRMSQRILGMGDVLTLIEKAESVIDEEEAERTMRKMQKGNFDLEDFLSQMKQIKKLGSLSGILKMIPGASKMGLGDVDIDPKQMAHLEALILSMTPEERNNPKIIKSSRKQRIAKGSGRTVQEVNRLLTQFEQMKQMMKMFGNGGMPSMGGMPGMGKMPGMGGMPGMPGMAGMGNRAQRRATKKKKKKRKR